MVASLSLPQPRTTSTLVKAQESVCQRHRSKESYTVGGLQTHCGVFFSDPCRYALHAIQAFFWLPPSVRRVTGPGRLVGRALEHGLVAELSRRAEPQVKGIRMRHRDGTTFFIDDSEMALRILEVMKSVASRLCTSMSEKMRHKTARRVLSRGARARSHLQFSFGFRLCKFDGAGACPVLCKVARSAVGFSYWISGLGALYLTVF